MKRAKKIKPRNPLATALLLKKCGAHARKGKRAARARQRALLRRQINGGE